MTKEEIDKIPVMKIALLISTWYLNGTIDNKQYNEITKLLSEENEYINNTITKQTERIDNLLLSIKATGNNILT